MSIRIGVAAAAVLLFGASGRYGARQFRYRI